MGYVTHNAIIVTSWNRDMLLRAYRKAVSLGCSVTPIIDSGINSYQSFMIGTDGSKEGWSESDAGDVRRAAFIEWTKSQRYDDRSSPLEWVEVGYGNDDHGARVTVHEWADK